jgi:hypothetical protein
MPKFLNKAFSWSPAFKKISAIFRCSISICFPDPQLECDGSYRQTPVFIGGDCDFKAFWLVLALFWLVAAQFVVWHMSSERVS